MIVYVSGPYSAPTEADVRANVNRAIDAGRALADAGHWPLIPHLLHWFDARCVEMEDAVRTWDFYLAWDLALLARCDALLYLWPSRGADMERSEAKRLGLPVYLRVEDVP